MKLAKLLVFTIIYTKYNRLWKTRLINIKNQGFCNKPSVIYQI